MFLSKIVTAAMKVETTQGTDATPGATDFVGILKPVFKLVPTKETRDYARMTLDQAVKVLGSVYAECTFDMEVKASGVAGTSYGPLSCIMQASGHSETVNAGVSVVYAPLSVPASSNFDTLGKSFTLKVYEAATAVSAGVLKTLTGGVVTALKMTAEAGKVAFWTVTVRGIYTAVADVANTPTETPSNIIPQVVQSANLAIHSYAAKFQKIEIDWGLKGETRFDGNSAYAIKGFYISGREPKGTLDPELTSVATHDWYGRMVNGTTGTLSFVIGSGAGKTFNFGFPVVQYDTADPTDRNGLMALSLNLHFAYSSGDDWMGLTVN